MEILRERSVGGIVLCGGRSTRMGQSKAWLPVGGEAMLQRVVRIVGEAVGVVVVVAAKEQELPSLPADVEVVRESGEHGPLQGIVTGMRALRDRVGVVYVSGCDVPLLRAEFVREIVNHLASGGRESPEPVARGNHRDSSNRESNRSCSASGDSRPPLASIPVISGRLHPLAAAYSLEALPILEAELAADRLRLTDLFDSLPSIRLTESDLGDLRSLRNVNTPDEYEQALRELLD